MDEHVSDNYRLLGRRSPARGTVERRKGTAHYSLLENDFFYLHALVLPFPSPFFSAFPELVSEAPNQHVLIWLEINTSPNALRMQISARGVGRASLGEVL